MTDVTIRWAGPSDATSGSTYKIERTYDMSSYTTLDATQASTSPYASVTTTLDGAQAKGSTTLDLTSATSVSASGYGWIGRDALVQWTGKTADQLTGVTWHSGYGTYATGAEFVEAHESYADTGATATNNAIVYRITHTSGDGVDSAPAYLWYYEPPTPASDRHCVVIVNTGADLGIAPQASLDVYGYLSADDQYHFAAGQHLDSNNIAANATTSNTLGLAFFHCWKNAYREGAGGDADASYTFIIDAADAAKQATFTATTIPDQDWVLLRDIVD